MVRRRQKNLSQLLFFWRQSMISMLAVQLLVRTAWLYGSSTIAFRLVVSGKTKTTVLSIRDWLQYIFRQTIKEQLHYMRTVSLLLIHYWWVNWKIPIALRFLFRQPVYVQNNENQKALDRDLHYQHVGSQHVESSLNSSFNMLPEVESPAMAPWGTGARVLLRLCVSTQLL